MTNTLKGHLNRDKTNSEEQICFSNYYVTNCLCCSFKQWSIITFYIFLLAGLVRYISRFSKMKLKFMLCFIFWKKTFQRNVDLNESLFLDNLYKIFLNSPLLSSCCKENSMRGIRPLNGLYYCWCSASKETASYLFLI